MCPCIASIILIFKILITTNKMELFWIYFFLNALHVSGGSSVNHQEHITVHTASGVVSSSTGWHYIYIYIHTHTHTHKYIYIFIYIYPTHKASYSLIFIIMHHLVIYQSLNDVLAVEMNQVLQQTCSILSSRATCCTRKHVRPAQSLARGQHVAQGNTSINPFFGKTKIKNRRNIDNLWPVN